MNNQYYAKIYVSRKKDLIPLMEQYYGKALPKKATHAQLVSIYIQLLKNPEFKVKVDKLEPNFKNAAGVLAGLVESVGGIFDGDVRTAKIEADAASDAALSELILAKQGTDNTGKILLFSGIAVVVVGAIITVIILKKRK